MVTAGCNLSLLLYIIDVGNQAFEFPTRPFLELSLVTFNHQTLERFYLWAFSSVITLNGHLGNSTFWCLLCGRRQRPESTNSCAGEHALNRSSLFNRKCAFWYRLAKIWAVVISFNFWESRNLRTTLATEQPNNDSKGSFVIKFAFLQLRLYLSLYTSSVTDNLSDYDT